MIGRMFRSAALPLALLATVSLGGCYAYPVGYPAYPGYYGAAYPAAYPYYAYGYPGYLGTGVFVGGWGGYYRGGFRYGGYYNHGWRGGYRGGWGGGYRGGGGRVGNPGNFHH